MKALNKYIDHTNLKPFATKGDIEKLCAEAREYDFASVCVNPCNVALASKLLAGSDVKVCTVVGFPLGASLPAIKAAEAAAAVADGADEVDMVQNISMAKEHDWKYIANEVYAVRKAIGKGITLKVILETCFLTDEEIVFSSRASCEGGADFVKTSTGFGKGGATTHAVKIMRDTVGPYIGVKASGGIHTYEELKALVKAGATRIGCSKSVPIAESLREK